MDDTLPSELVIMPDYGPSYLCDEHGCVLDMASLFECHERWGEIAVIEQQLLALAYQIDEQETIAPDYDWGGHEQQTLELARQLSLLLADSGIRVRYQPHYHSTAKHCLRCSF